MPARKTRKPAARDARAPREREENPSVQITPEQAEEVKYKDDVAPQESETEYAEGHRPEEESPNGEVVKDGVVVSTDESRREAEEGLEG